MTSAAGQRGLTLLEFTLFAMIMAALVVFAVERIARMRVHMERAAVEHSVARIREALAVRFAELVTEGRARAVIEQAGTNPLRWPGIVRDYAGVRRAPPARERGPGEWYFDAATGSVVYVPRFPDAIDWPRGSPRLLRWRVRPDWVDVDGDGEFDRGSDRLQGLDLVRLDAARWRVGGEP